MFGKLLSDLWRGVFKIWSDEHIAIGKSKRVQDRTRTVTPTKVTFPTEVQDQKLTGKIGSVFLLWGICLAVSFMVFVTENLYKIFKCN